MVKLAPKLSVVLFCLAALMGCGKDNPKKGLGSIRFSLDIPGGQKVDTLQLHLVCAGSGVDVTHTLDVKNGEVVAVFGGLQPGPCTVNIQTQTQSGVDCIGVKTFTVVAKEIITVEVPLICQGFNDGPVGIVKITPKVSTNDCSKDRIKVVYAIPANIRIGEGTVVQVEVDGQAVVGTPKISWALRNDASYTGQGTLASAPAECKPNSASCNRLTCTGLGGNPTIDPRTQLPIGGMFVGVTVEDDHCFDTEEVWVYCMQAGVCGDGMQGGAEECDDRNTANNDGCSATCKREVCGDGVVQPGEECDGAAGVPQGQGCSAACKVVAPRCGDGIKNQTSEACDGADGVVANQQCSASCQIVPICGNNVVEPPEQCDSVSDAMCVNCMLVGPMGPRCGDGMVNQTTEVCDGTAGLMTGQMCSATCQIIPMCGNGIVEAPEQCDSTTNAMCVNCMLMGTMAPRCGDGMVNQTTEVCDGTAGLMAGQMCSATCQIVPRCGNNIVEAPEACDSTTDATCVNCMRQSGTNMCRQCIDAGDQAGPFTRTSCDPAPLCVGALGCMLASKCWDPVPLECYCGKGTQNVDNCESPSFVPSGVCAAELKAGAGSNPTNKEVVERYFDPAYPTGVATLIADEAFRSCYAQCF